MASNDLDLSRKLWPILGLPFDVLTMEQAVERIREAIKDKEKLFISTPNLNFAISALKDVPFRQSVINSDLSLADGMPLVWVARLLSIPLQERVAGSSLIERLMKPEARNIPPIKVFFFGGNEGVAQRACEILRQKEGGLEPAGYYYPGFGSVEEMSRSDVINAINRSGAEFIIVALGAKKGQAWIEKNRDRLAAPVISHLGAVVNFVAGANKRAPLSVQRSGLEWLWRIKEEPKLWRRYLFDGLQFLKLIFLKILPYYFFLKRHKKKSYAAPRITSETDAESGKNVLILQGALNAEHLPMLCSELKMLPTNDELEIDLDAVSYMAPEFVGLLLLIKKHWRELELRNPSKVVRKILSYNCVEFLLTQNTP